MEVNWRVSAAFAGVAFILSILSGAIAGVGFGLLLLRAVIGSVAFAVVGAGLSLIIARFLPDLQHLSGNHSAKPNDSYNEPGSRVDIVLPAEQNDYGDSEYRPDAGDGDDALDDDTLVEEVEELSSADGPIPVETGARAGHRAGDMAVSGTGAQEVEPVSDEETSELLAADVEDLPDIGGLAGSFEGHPDELEQSVSRQESARQPGSSGIDPADPELIARALRTVLKRDQS